MKADLDFLVQFIQALKFVCTAGGMAILYNQCIDPMLMSDIFKPFFGRGDMLHGKLLSKVSTETAMNSNHFCRRDIRQTDHEEEANMIPASSSAKIVDAISSEQVQNPLIPIGYFPGKFFFAVASGLLSSVEF